MSRSGMSGGKIGPVDRFKAWLVTGPLGRGFAFALDFAAALRTMLAKRRSR